MAGTAARPYPPDCARLRKSRQGPPPARRAYRRLRLRVRWRTMKCGC